MKYSIKVKVCDNPGARPSNKTYTWKLLKSSIGHVYKFDTWRDAVDMANICYPNDDSWTITEVENERD